MTTKDEHPDVVLQALLIKGNRRDKEAKLRKLHELCALEYSRHSQGARDLSLANMSKAAELQGLFKARTVYNKQSKDYAALIFAWESYNGPKTSKLLKEKGAPSEKYAFLKKIDDPAVRSLCHIAIIERDKIKAELNLLKSITQVIVDMRPLGNGIGHSPSRVVIEPAVQLTESERNALINAIDPKTLIKRQWKLGDTGEVVDDRNRFVFMPGFATAIIKIIGKKS